MQNKASRLCLGLGYDHEEIKRIVQLAGYGPVVMSRRDDNKRGTQLKEKARRGIKCAPLAG